MRFSIPITPKPDKNYTTTTSQLHNSYISLHIATTSQPWTMDRNYIKKLLHHNYTTTTTTTPAFTSQLNAELHQPSTSRHHPPLVRLQHYGCEGWKEPRRTLRGVRHSASSFRGAFNQCRHFCTPPHSKLPPATGLPARVRVNRRHDERGLVLYTFLHSPVNLTPTLANAEWADET